MVSIQKSLAVIANTQIDYELISKKIIQSVYSVMNINKNEN